MNNFKSILRIFFVIFVISVLIFSINSGSAALNTDQYTSGSYIASFNGFTYGNIVYKSIESNGNSVATIETDFGGIAPFHPYFAQSLNINGTMFYLSNSIGGFEIFNDTNHNGYIDSINEMAYYVLLNATQGFTYSNISESTVGNDSIYTWSSDYYNIDGFPVVNPDYAGQLPQLSSGQSRKVIIPSFNITYTVTNSVNTSDLSIKYDIGAWNAYVFHSGNNYNDIIDGPMNLTGFGLSIIYTSVIRSNEPVTKIDNSNGGIISNIEFTYNSKPIFESVLNDTYTLNNNSTQLPVKTVIADPNTTISDQNTNWRLTHDYLDSLEQWNSSIENLPSIPDNTVPIQQMFNYRICYPQWNGELINHDPVYKIYKFGSKLTNIAPFKLPTINGVGLLVLSASAGFIVILAIVIIEKRK